MKLAIGQTKIKLGDKKWNFQNSASMLKQASGENADIILFPEMSFTGFSMNTDQTRDNNCETLTAIRNIIDTHKISVGFGWVKGVENSAENHYTIVNELGMEISDYIKIHPFSYAKEEQYFSPGNEISIFEMKGISLSTFICYDLRFPELFQAASDKASIIIVPANWPASRIKHWRCLLKARAIENQCYIIGINCVGNQGINYYSGNSCVFNPNGELIVDGTDKEELFVCNIDNDATGYREDFPTKKDRRVELYKRLL